MWFPRLPILCGGLLAMLLFGGARVRAADEINPLSPVKIGLKAPPGFEVSLYADDALAHDIFSLAIDAHGRVVVAGPGYVKVLHDDQGVGRANRATVFSTAPSNGSQGMYFDGDDLICVGNGQLQRVREGDSPVDHPPLELFHFDKKSNGEHSPHSVVKGPDGWYYVISGNVAAVLSKYLDVRTSPIADVHCGFLLRVSPDGKRAEVVADGFRNPYDFGFTPTGSILTVDSDGERDYHLPWYAPCRLFDVVGGQHYGWLQELWHQTWNRPASFFDSAPRIWEIGRGSPTGLVVYRHRAFPERYRGGVFSACWTLGKVYYFPLVRDGSSYSTRLETFLEPTGGAGFAFTGMAIDPAGDMYLAIGGRGTQGSVYRVHYNGPAVKPIEGSPLAQVLAADEPLSSWSRAHWIPLAKKLGAAPFQQAVINPKLDTLSRIRALEVLVELFDGPTLELAQAALTSNDAELTARVAWAMSRCNQAPADLHLLAMLTHDADLRVQRAAWEALQCSSLFREGVGSSVDDARLNREVNLAEAIESKDRWVRAVAYDAARQRGLHELSLKKVSWRQSLAPLRLATKVVPAEWDFDACLAAFDHSQDNVDVRLEAVRLIQLGLGDVENQSANPETFDGYVARKLNEAPQAKRQSIEARLAAAFPSGDDELDRELGRTLALLQIDDPSVLAAVAAHWTPASSPVDDVHYLVCLARLGGARSTEVTRQTAHALADLSPKMARLGMMPSDNWPFRVGEALDELIRLDPLLPRAIADDRAFGVPEHSLLLKHMLEADARYAATKLLARVQKDQDVEWTPDLVSALTVLPYEKLAPVLRDQWENVALRDSIALVFAQHPDEKDRAALRLSLSSVQANVVSQAALALGLLKSPGKPAEIRAALQALRQCNAPNQRGARKDLAQLLAHWSGQKIEVEEPPAPADPKDLKDPLEAYKPWFDWFAKAYPDESKKLAQSGPADMNVWNARLEKIDWDSGDVKRGLLMFQRKGCARCHTGAGKVGPDLQGVGARFSRHDMFVAILDPSKDVAPQYRTTTVITRNGEVYTGLMFYESPEAILLRTGPDVTVKIEGANRLAVRPSRQSLMPDGLLNDATDQDCADLYAFLKSQTVGSKAASN